ncbi:MAG: DUF488 family protein [Methanothrix sp.]|jgi:uncharacterized protein YeaO (DUF488 family)|nr:DUF488 family protein [Methanothrix sp.]NLX38522.1 DUF488 family protein [Methanothrix sp.]HPY72906.1 DUF488 family protein [Methanothrix sp.]
MIRIKRAYDPPGPEDGRRFLVDRLWPRGVGKAALKVDGWIKEAAPSDGLRRWYGHDPSRWEEFRRRYEEELEANRAAWEPLLEEARSGDVTLIYSARDEEQNNAVVLKDRLQRTLDDL